MQSEIAPAVAVSRRKLRVRKATKLILIVMEALDYRIRSQYDGVCRAGKKIIKPPEKEMEGPRPGRKNGGRCEESVWQIAG